MTLDQDSLPFATLTGGDGRRERAAVGGDRGIRRGGTAAVRLVRELDSSYREDDREEVFSAKLAITVLDIGLVLPALFARLVLTHDPDAAEARRLGLRSASWRRST